MVKAIIATESSFRTSAKIKAGKRAGYAMGLMRVTDWTQSILADEKGELRDHLVNVSQKDMADPNANIAAGIRWLFRKKETAKARLGREASWYEAVAEYKAYLQQMKSGNVPKNMKAMQTYWETLKACKS